MRLSDAIRLGSMLRPQASGHFFLNGGSCAQGAALEAVGVSIDMPPGAQSHLHDDISRLWPWAGKKAAVMACPLCAFKTIPSSIAGHLNNDVGHGGHGWTREQIADWVEQIEAQHEQAQPAPQPVAETV